MLWLLGCGAGTDADRKETKGTKGPVSADTMQGWRCERVMGRRWNGRASREGRRGRQGLVSALGAFSWGIEQKDTKETKERPVAERWE